MTEIPARELRNYTNQILRRVESGEKLRITVSGRPVAEIIPLSGRKLSVSREEFVQRFLQSADAGLLDQLAQVVDTSEGDSVDRMQKHKAAGK